MHLRNGDNLAALTAYQDGLAIAKKLAELDPNIVEWQTDLVVSYVKLSQVQPEQQQDLLMQSLAILQRLNKENKLDAEKSSWLTMLEEALQ